MANSEPWFEPPPVFEGERRALVIGAGLAGASTAFALAKRGYDVSVWERESKPASLTSAHPAAVIFPMPALERHPMARFYEVAYRFGLDHIESLMAAGKRLDWHQTGVLHYAVKATPQRLYDRFEESKTPPDVAVRVSPEEAARLSGTRIEGPALFYPRGGWIDPRNLVNAMLEDERIEVTTYREALSLERVDRGWLVRSAELTACFPLVVLATAWEVTGFEATSWLNLRKIRGQLAYVDAGLVSERPKMVICHDGYWIPDCHGFDLLGATFDFKGRGLDLDDHNQNLLLERAEAHLPPLRFKRPVPLRGRAAMRTTTYDHLPVIGPVPDYEAYLSAFGGLRQGQRFGFGPAPYLPGLWVNTGHGSRGTLTCPLAGELIAQQICGEKGLLPYEAERAVHPARMLIKPLKRGDI